MKDSYIHVRQDKEIRKMAEELAKKYEGNISLMIRSLIRKEYYANNSNPVSNDHTKEDAHV